MTEMIAALERQHPNVRAVMWNALSNVRPSHLLDAEVLEAWESRDPSIRPAEEPAPRKEHAAAMPLISKLRVIQ
jgi:hypothetical protein